MIKCTHFKCTFQWVLTNLYTHITIIMSKKMNMFIILKSSLVCLPRRSVVSKIKIIGSPAPWQQISALDKQSGRCAARTLWLSLRAPAPILNTYCHEDLRTHVFFLRKHATARSEACPLTPTAHGEPLDSRSLLAQTAAPAASWAPCVFLSDTLRSLCTAPGKACACHVSPTSVCIVPGRGLAHSRCSICRCRMNEWEGGLPARGPPMTCAYASSNGLPKVCPSSPTFTNVVAGHYHFIYFTLAQQVLLSLSHVKQPRHHLIYMEVPYIK